MYRFLGAPRLIYDNEGQEVYRDLKEGQVYQVDTEGILMITIKGRMYLKEYFQKIKKW